MLLDSHVFNVVSTHGAPLSRQCQSRPAADPPPPPGIVLIMSHYCIIVKFPVVIGNISETLNEIESLSQDTSKCMTPAESCTVRCPGPKRHAPKHSGTSWPGESCSHAQ